jgi:Transcriptional regulator, AbiEi antitoxin, Type IV TA system
MLLEPGRWWRQRDLVQTTGLDDGSVSRVVRRLDQELLLEHRERELRPRDPNLLLNAWAHDYRFDRHDILRCHLSGSGIDLARKLGKDLESRGIHHAFTGLPAAWAIDHFASYRLTTVYVENDPRDVADQLEARQSSAGANVQLVGPDDIGVFTGEQQRDGLNCVAPLQVYLDLLHLPERAGEAAEHLRPRVLEENIRDR